MRKTLIGLLVAVALTIAIAAYVLLRAPAGGDRRSLLAAVPDSAESFALIPNAARAYRRIERNPITRELFGKWRREQPLPPPWMLGATDLVVWKSGKRIGYAARLDPFRALVARLYLTLATDTPHRFDGGILTIGEGPTTDDRRPTTDDDTMLDLARDLGERDATVIHRASARGAFPPIGRPAVTVVTVHDSDIEIVSRSAAATPLHDNRINVRYPRSALLTVAFARPPRAIDDLNRLVQTRVSTLVGDGGAIALYDVDTGKLLPRPRQVIVLPATEERRLALERFVADVTPRALRDALGFRIETARSGSELLVAFERATLDRYLGDQFDPLRLAANQWSLRADPASLAPVLDRVADNVGLRIAAPRLFRSARDLRKWIGGLKGAKSIEAADSVTGRGEELRVVISSK